MTYIFYTIIFLGLLILQTTIMPCFSMFDRFYDLQAPFIIYLGLFRSTRESIPVIVAAGIIMDSLSGSPLGLYPTAYIWLFVGVRWIMTVLHVGDSLLVPLVVAMGVLLENIIFIGTLNMAAPGPDFFSGAVGTVAVQMLWALCTGPFLLLLFNYAHRSWDRWIEQLLDFDGEQSLTG